MTKTEVKGLALTRLWAVWPVDGSLGVIACKDFCWSGILLLNSPRPQLPPFWSCLCSEFWETHQIVQTLCWGHSDQDLLLFLWEVELLTPGFVIPRSLSWPGHPSCLVQFFFSHAVPPRLTNNKVFIFILILTSDHYFVHGSLGQCSVLRIL